MNYRTHEKKGRLAALRRFLRLVWQIHPSLYFWVGASTIFQLADVLLTAYIPKWLIDSLQQQAGWDRIGRLLLGLFFFKAGLLYLQENIKVRTDKENLHFQDKFQTLISQKAMSLPYAMLEDPAILDLKEEATSSVTMYGVLFSLFQANQKIIHSLSIIITAAVILMGFNPLLFLALTLLSLLSAWVSSRAEKVYTEVRKEMPPINRRANYFTAVMMDDNRQDEYRLFDLGMTLKDKFMEYMSRVLGLLKDLEEKTVRYQLLNQLIQGLAKAASLLAAGVQLAGLYGRRISLGDFTLYFSLSSSYMTSFSDMIKAMYDIYSSLFFLFPLLDYMDLPEEKEENGNEDQPTAGSLHSLEFRDVSFSYPGSKKKILNHVSFKVKEGESLALVGQNGSGKSTIVKLIARFYQPDEGTILWNGQDIQTLSYSSYLDQLAFVFQDFRLFPFTLETNVSCQWQELEAEEKQQREEAVWTALEKVGMASYIHSLPQGINSWLNPHINEGGTNLSGGQAQKVAIARAICKPSSFAILDEPTAALDPLAESQIYSDFNTLVKGQTALFISHRMSASRFCDRIIVLEDGRISGTGSHEELMKTNSLYQTLYQAQSQYYEKA